MTSKQRCLMATLVFVSVGYLYSIVEIERFDNARESFLKTWNAVSDTKSTRLTSNRQIKQRCQMDSCFKYRNCPIFTNLSFKIHSSTANSSENGLLAALLRSDSFVNESRPSCVTIMLLNDCGHSVTDFMNRLSVLHDEFSQTNLVVWMNFAAENYTDCVNDYNLITQTQENPILLNGAIVVSQFVSKTTYQYEYDIVPSYFDNPNAEVFARSTVRRKILAYFDDSCSQHKNEMNSILRATIHSKNKEGTPNFQFACEKSKEIGISTICKNEDTILQNSIFTVTSLPRDTNTLSTLEIQRKLWKILRLGSIPVIVGRRLRLPYDELIDWSRIVIKIPVDHMCDLPNILENYSESIQEAMRINGRLAFNEYFSSLDKSVKGVLDTISSRLNWPGIYYISNNFKSGQSEMPIPQKSNTANITQLLISNHTNEDSKWFFSDAARTATPKLWVQNFNNIETELNSSISLPSSLAQEKFTIVMMTYNRVNELMKSLNYLNGLPKLDKIVIVWNSPDPPPERNTSWPSNMTAPIHVVRMEINSLNNRFFPFDAIQTDAILNLDDDVYVSHENLLLGFRAWQENRDRLVGFPGRSVSMNPKSKKWFYDTKGFPVSLILTGCTFLHKMYHVLYTFQMPKSIRSIVDKNMNCEDIAMNFLIAHHTQKPPIKVTSQMTFGCPKCGKPTKNSLWTRPTHFTDRNACISEFSKAYGYTALFNTEYFAADLIQDKNQRRQSRSRQ